MQIRNLCPGAWGSNCYLLTVGTHAAVVDPSADARTILDAINEAGATLDFILLTHGHFDHIISLDALRDATSAPAMIHEDDLLFPETTEKNLFLPFFGQARTWRRPEKVLHDGDLLTLGGEDIRVIHIPGHTPGGVCFLCNDCFLLTGDSLFYNCCGRCDHYGGNMEQQLSSLHRLRMLPQDLPIYPGHGRSAVLGPALDTVID